MFIEGCSHKIRRQIEDLEKVSGILSSSLTVDGVSVDSYLTKFMCDEAKHPTMSQLKEIVDGIHAWPVGLRLLAIKFLETCVLLFMSDNDSKGHITEGLKKITDDMKATNRKDRAGFVSSGEKKARKSALYAAKVGPTKA
nr:V-type proton ATPase subunit C-like [Tanacetum cinerariifolium]